MAFLAGITLAGVTQTLAAAGAAAGIAGTIISVSAQTTEAERRAQAAEAEAQSIEEEAKFQERQQRREDLRTQGFATAAAAASGIDLTQGTPLLLELDRARQAEIEALHIRRSGKNLVAVKRFESVLERKKKIGAQISGGLRATSILGSFISSPSGQAVGTRIGGYFT